MLKDCFSTASLCSAAATRHAQLNRGSDKCKAWNAASYFDLCKKVGPAPFFCRVLAPPPNGFKPILGSSSATDLHSSAISGEGVVDLRGHFFQSLCGELLETTFVCTVHSYSSVCSKSKLSPRSLQSERVGVPCIPQAEPWRPTRS